MPAATAWPTCQSIRFMYTEPIIFMSSRLGAAVICYQSSPLWTSCKNWSLFLRLNVIVFGSYLLRVVLWLDKGDLFPRKKCTYCVSVLKSISVRFLFGSCYRSHWLKLAWTRWSFRKVREADVIVFIHWEVSVRVCGSRARLERWVLVKLLFLLFYINYVNDSNTL